MEDISPSAGGATYCTSKGYREGNWDAYLASLMNCGGQLMEKTMFHRQVWYRSGNFGGMEDLVDSGEM